MQATLQGLEGEGAMARDRQFPVEHEGARPQRAQIVQYLGEKPR